MLFLTTVYDGSETTVCLRKRPKGGQPYSRPIRRFFGDKGVKEVSVPSIAADYNLYMNAVDRGDHLRANMKTQHRQRRGPARALAWSFMLKTAITNSFILQRDGQPAFEPSKTLSEWQDRISDAICEHFYDSYRQTATSRKRYRAGDEFTPVWQHKWGLGDVGEPDQPGPPEAPAAQWTRYGCLTCNVALCTEGKCWYIYHQPIY